MQFMDKIDGIAFVKITSGYPAGTLKKLQEKNIQIYDVTAPDSFTLHFTAKRKDIHTISHVCNKRGERVDIEGWTGWIFYLLGLIKRPVFLLGIMIWLFLALWLPNRIIFVCVDGTNKQPTDYILECAADCGIRMGALGRQVRSEQVKNELLSMIPSLQWVGVNTNGCVATIYVKEKPTTETTIAKPATTDILATQDAIIREITVQSGTALCKPGQAVKAGQALISCYRDNGQVLEFTGAVGEVYGETKRQIQVATPLNAYKKGKILSVDENSYLIVGKNPIKFQKDSGILDGSCVKMYEIKECTLPGGFTLPVLLVKEYITTYTIEPVTLTESDCGWVEDYAKQHLQNSLIAGRILFTQSITAQTDDLYTVIGTYNCLEMIADYEYKGISINHGEDN